MTVHERRPVSLRHIKQVPAGAPGAVDVVTASFAAQPIEGVNGPAGWVTGEFELRLLEEGRFTLQFPNDGGADGILHRDRFLCITDPNYAPGDEWLEIYEGEQPGLTDPLIVGTPTEPTLNRGQVTLEGYDLLELYKTIRETNAGFWNHAPRDVFSHYTRIWQFLIAEDFAGGLPAGWTLTHATHDPTPGSVVMAGGTGAPGGYSRVRTPELLEVGRNAPDPHAPWRVEFGFDRFDTISLAIGLASLADGASNQIQLLVSNTGTANVVLTVGATTRAARADLDPAAPLTLALEGRDRFVFGYVNGQLLAILPMPALDAELLCAQAYIGPAAPAGGATLSSVVVRHGPRFGLRGVGVGGSGGIPGDYRLPGLPQPGGLIGSYFDDRQALALGLAATYTSRVLLPGGQPIARRVDPTINFAPASPPAWRPAGLDTERWSVRWAGSIYLDLAAEDRQVRLADFDDGARLWIGRTRIGEELVDDFTLGSSRTVAGDSNLRAHLDTQESGWYPIVIEYLQGTGGAGIRLQDKPVSGAFAAVPASRLSPQGIYEAQIRGDSHYEQLQEMARTFGLQFRAVGHALESGQFPGQLVPRVRVGRDTARIIDETNGPERERKLNTRDTVQVLVIDAAGLAKDGAQLQHEQINFAQVGRHLIAHTDQLSLAEIAVPQVLARRAQTMQELRSTALEELGVRPEDSKELIDTWPLTGAAALFDYQPGDGVLCRFADLAVHDLTGRRLTAVNRPIRPLALGPPAVSFRPRPRSARSQLRDVARQQSAPRRNDQGQIVLVPGNYAQEPVDAIITDRFTRAPFPTSADQLVDAYLVIMRKTGANEYDVSVNGDPTSMRISTAGRIPILQILQRQAGSGAQRVYVELTPVSTPDTFVQFVLELYVRI